MCSAYKGSVKDWTDAVFHGTLLMGRWGRFGAHRGCTVCAQCLEMASQTKPVLRIVSPNIKFMYCKYDGMF